MEAEEEKDEGRWKNIVEAVICIGFLGGVLALRWTQAETVWYLVLGGAAAVVGIVSLALELASRWKKRSREQKQEAMGRPQESGNKEKQEMYFRNIRIGRA